jgi:hypothetical protein
MPVTKTGNARAQQFIFNFQKQRTPRLSPPRALSTSPCRPAQGALMDVPLHQLLVAIVGIKKP